MIEHVKPLRMTIRNALLQFCFEERIEAVTVFEQHFTSQELLEIGYPNLGGASNKGEPKHPNDRQMEYRRRLKLSWRSLLLDFCQRLERGEIVMTGVEISPNRETERRTIPGQWAAEFRIDALNNTIDIGRTRYVAILVGLPNAFKDDPGLDKHERRKELDEATIDGLTDDEILLLLEEHACRVITSPDAKLIAPGKISLIPLIRRKMLYRAEHHEILNTLSAEAAFLAEWIASKVTAFQVPSASTIGKLLSTDYQLRGPRSKPAIK